jgi:hypothetical protein
MMQNGSWFTHVFKSIKKRFSKYKLHFEDKITYNNLFAEDKGNWERTRVFELVL